MSQDTGPSTTPQARKLDLKPGLRVQLVDAPDGWTLTDPPDGLLDADPTGQADVIVAFFTTAASLAERLPHLVRRIFPDGALWIAWPRRAAGHVSDLGDWLVRELALANGVVDVKIAAIDHDWSGQKVVWRLADRGPRPRGR